MLTSPRAFTLMKMARLPTIRGMEIDRSLRQLDRCRYPSGLYAAVPADSAVRLEIYASVWLRDTVYTLLAYEAIGDEQRLREGVHALLDHVLLRWAPRIDWRIVHGLPDNQVEYLHPRFAPDGSEMHHELWGLRQDDAIGLVIWALSRWHKRFGVLRNDFEDFHLIQKLIWYLDRIDVPNLPDNGIWEEEEPTQAIHLSSLAAVAAGLNQAERIGIADIPARLGEETALAIERLAGRESAHHDTDLALLTAVWPLGDDVPIPATTQREIVERVERELLGTRGVVRYIEDTYHVCHGGPPEWTMGLGFLALAWNRLGEPTRAVDYLDRLDEAALDTGELPESWCRDPAHHRYFNSPLCWSHALHVIAATDLAAARTPALAA